MRKKLTTKLLSVTLAVTIPFTGMHTANAAEATQLQTAVLSQIQQTPKDPALANKADDLEQALELINSIPDSVLQQGDEATQKWIKEHQTISARANIPGCTAAIALFIGSNLVGAAKILKIKRLIKSLGGVKQAVQAMWGASFSYEKMQAVGGALATLAGEFFGITSIRNECFN